MRSATAGSSSLHQRRRSVATWSLRLRPVCSRAPAGPASSVTRRSIAVCTSSSVGAKANVPAASSPATWSSASRTAATSVPSSKPARPSPRTCACEPRTSCGHRRWSNGRLAVYARSSSAGPDANRPCQRVAPVAVGGAGCSSPLAVTRGLGTARPGRPGPAAAPPAGRHPRPPRPRRAWCRRRPPCPGDPPGRSGRGPRRRRGRSRAASAGRRACPECATSATHSAITRRSWSSGAIRSGSYSGMA